MANIYTFCITNESHTIGNLLADFIIEKRLAKFASYRVPHPLCQDVHVTVKSDSLQEAQKVIATACDGLMKDFHNALVMINASSSIVMDSPTTSEVSVFTGLPIRNGDMR